MNIGQDYDLFQILTSWNEEKHFPSLPVYTYNLSVELREQLAVAVERGNYDFFEANLADIKCYLHEVPTIKSGEKTIPNPVAKLVTKIDNMLECADKCWTINSYSSDIRLLYWFDN